MEERKRKNEKKKEEDIQKRYFADFRRKSDMNTNGH